MLPEQFYALGNRPLILRRALINEAEIISYNSVTSEAVSDRRGWNDLKEFSGEMIAAYYAGHVPRSSKARAVI